MATPQSAPDPQNPPVADSQPSTAGPATNQSPDADSDADPDPNASGNPETAIQEELGDGAGVRGGYGDASQENGMEGGPNSAPDGSPGV